MHPVVQISFNSGRSTSHAEFNQRTLEILRLSQDELQVSCDPHLTVGGCFEQLVIRAYQKYGQRVVILINEYDKPILDNIDQSEIAVLIREELKNFYSVI